MSELIKADNEYKEWIAGISTDFRKSQIRASMKINDEMYPDAVICPQIED